MHPDRFLSCAHVLFEYLIDLALSIPDQDSRLSKQAEIEKAGVKGPVLLLKRFPQNHPTFQF